MIVRLLGGRGSSHEPEMTVRPAVGMAVQSPTVAVNVRVGCEHRVKLPQAVGYTIRMSGLGSNAYAAAMQPPWQSYRLLRLRGSGAGSAA